MSRWQAEKSAIIANPRENAAAELRLTANAGNERFFCEGHVET
jgi:hypothetical protein